MPLTAADLITDALRELGILNAVDPASGEDATLGLLRLNKILDNLNADRNGVYAQQFTTFTLTPSLNPHTIGPAGATWTATQRPVSVESAQLISGSNYYPIRIRDAQWYRGVSLPGLTGIPTDVYVDDAWPLGQLFFYPIPSAASQVRLETRILLAALALADTFTLPPGYQDAITLTLAEDLAAPFRVAVPPKTEENARTARNRVFRNNSRIPRITTYDSGMPSGGGSTFDYLTGQ